MSRVKVVCWGELPMCLSSSFTIFPPDHMLDPLKSSMIEASGSNICPDKGRIRMKK